MFGFVSKKKYDQLAEDFAELYGRIQKIKAMETPHCASIGKRMAAVARGEGK